MEGGFRESGVLLCFGRRKQTPLQANRDPRVERRVFLSRQNRAQRKPRRSRKRHRPWPYVESKAKRIERRRVGMSRKYGAVVGKSKQVETVIGRAEIMVQFDIGVDAAVARHGA